MILQITSPLPILAALLIALSLASLLVKLFGAPAADERFATIDGLRGYLAFFVFLHHSSYWYFYLHTGHWHVENSNLYTHLGQSSVALFFMITGFLFFSKIISNRSKPLDWLRLAVSRILRLVPLYLVAMGVVFTTVFVVTQGKLVEPPGVLARNVMGWLLFTFPGLVDINGMDKTFTITAGVTWSLPYEWFFYVCLPFMAILTGRSVPKRYLIGSALLVGLMLWAWRPTPIHLYAFLGGAVAAVAVKFEMLRKLARTPVASLVVIGCLALLVAIYPNAYGRGPLLLLSIAFTLIACGTRLFGLLTHPASRMLGEMAYGIYLLHGIVIFTFLKFIFIPSFGMPSSPLLHWAAMLGLIPVLIGICFLSFIFIERPAMNAVGRVTAYLRSGRRGRSAQPSV